MRGGVRSLACPRCGYFFLLIGGARNETLSAAGGGSEAGVGPRMWSRIDLC